MRSTLKLTGIVGKSALAFLFDFSKWLEYFCPKLLTMFLEFSLALISVSWSYSSFIDVVGRDAMLVSMSRSWLLLRLDVTFYFALLIWPLLPNVLASAWLLWPSWLGEWVIWKDCVVLRRNLLRGESLSSRFFGESLDLSKLSAISARFSMEGRLGSDIRSTWLFWYVLSMLRLFLAFADRMLICP